VCAQQLLAYVRDPELGEAALWGIRKQLLWDHDPQYPKSPGLAERDWLLEELQKATHDANVPEETKIKIHGYVGHVLGRPEPIDWAVLGERLFDRSDRIYHGWADGQTAKLLRQAQDACDPRLIPILVEVLEKVPEASGNHGHQFQEALRFYAEICP